MKAADAAARIWDTLERHPGGLSKKMLCHYADISESQLRRGLDYIADTFEDETEGPIFPLRRGGEYIYTFAQTELDTREYWTRWLRGQITRARREYNKWHKTYLKFPTVENERQEELARRRVVDLRYAQDRMFGQERISA